MESYELLEKEFENKGENVTVLLHKPTVHSKLEYCVKFWFLEEIWKSQRRPAKMTVDVK